MAIPNNPYIAGEPVGYKNVFVGRKDILESIKSDLLNSTENVILLYGQRRVGKTSILQYLEKQLKSECQFSPVYFSLHGASEYSLPQVLQELALTITNKLDLSDPPKRLAYNPEQVFYKEWLPDVFQKLPDGNALVLLVDELDVLADPSRNRSLDAESLPAYHLFKYFKTLATDYAQHLKLIFVIGRNKEDLLLAAQPLFRGIVRSHLISLLTPSDVLAIAKLSENNRTLFWTESALGRLIQLTNGHPFFTQELCSLVWELTYDQKPIEPPNVTDREIDNALPSMLDNISPHLHSFWSSWSVDERVAAIALAEIGPNPTTQEQLENLLQEKSQLRIVIRQVHDAIQRLRERDVLELIEGHFKFRVELVRKWIIFHKKLDDVQDELDNVRTAAEDLYRAASKLYRDGEVEKAIEPARQAFEMAPYRFEVTQLWADILVTQEKLSEAQELLEQLYEYEPSAASARLIKLYLLLAQRAQGDDKKLELYERVLAINPSSQQALKESQKIWKYKASVTERLAIASDKLEDWEVAYEAYQKANLRDKANELDRKIQQRAISEGQQHLDELEQAKKYTEALVLLDALENKYVSSLWDTYRERLTPKADLAKFYQEAIAAMKKGAYEDAQELLIQIIREDPQYGEATVLLHQAVKGDSFSELLQQLTETQERCLQIETEALNSQAEIKQAQAMIIRLNEALSQSHSEIQLLRAELEIAEAQVQQEKELRHQCGRDLESQKRQITTLQQKIQQQERKYNEGLLEKDAATQNQIQAIQDAWGTKYQQVEEERNNNIQENEKIKKRIEKLDGDLKSTRDLLDDKQRLLREERAKFDKLRLTLIALIVMLLLSVGYNFLTF